MSSGQKSDYTGRGYLADVIRSASDGNPEAVASLYREHSSLVNGYFRACGIQESEDLTSEVFIGVLTGLAQFNGDATNFRTWLMSIAYRRMVDYRRREHRSKVEFRSPESIEKVGDVGQLDGTLGIDPSLIEAFEQLTPAQKEVLALRFIADMELGQVAIVTARPLGAVKSLQHRGLRSLRLAMERLVNTAIEDVIVVAE